MKKENNISKYDLNDMIKGIDLVTNNLYDSLKWKTI